MAEVEPKTFVLELQEGPVEVLGVTLHEDIRSDRDGRAHSHFSLSGTVKAVLDDFETITAALKFAFYDGDSQLGEVCAKGLRFAADGETVAFGPLEGPPAPSDARISRLVLELEAIVVTRSSRTVDLMRSEA